MKAKSRELNINANLILATELSKLHFGSILKYGFTLYCPE